MWYHATLIVGTSHRYASYMLSPCHRSTRTNLVAEEALRGFMDASYFATACHIINRLAWHRHTLPTKRRMVALCHPFRFSLYAHVFVARLCVRLIDQPTHGCYTPLSAYSFFNYLVIPFTHTRRSRTWLFGNKAFHCFMGIAYYAIFKSRSSKV